MSDIYAGCSLHSRPIRGPKCKGGSGTQKRTAIWRVRSGYVQASTPQRLHGLRASLCPLTVPNGPKTRFISYACMYIYIYTHTAHTLHERLQHWAKLPKPPQHLKPQTGRSKLHNKLLNNQAKPQSHPPKRPIEAQRTKTKTPPPYRRRTRTCTDVCRNFPLETLRQAPTLNPKLPNLI